MAGITSQTGPVDVPGLDPAILPETPLNLDGVHVERRTERHTVEIELDVTALDLPAIDDQAHLETRHPIRPEKVWLRYERSAETWWASARVYGSPTRGSGLLRGWAVYGTGQEWPKWLRQLGDTHGPEKPRAELVDLRERFAALAAVEGYIGESCNNASHNIRNVLAGDDPRPDADKWGLDYRAGGEPE